MNGGKNKEDRQGVREKDREGRNEGEQKSLIKMRKRLMNETK